MNSISTMQLPSLLLKGIVPLPNTELRIDITEKADIKTLKLAEQYQNYLVILVPKVEGDDSNNNDKYNEIAIFAKIVLNMIIPNGLRRVKIQMLSRCKVLEISQIDQVSYVKMDEIPVIEEEASKVEPVLNLIKSEVLTSQNFMSIENRDAVEKAFKSSKPDVIADTIASSLKLDFTTRLKYLNTLSVSERLEMLLSDLKKQKFFAEIEAEIEEQVKKNIGESQKEYYLREKMKVIQDELGDKAKKETDIEMLRTKINESLMPQSMKDKALNELNRYISVPSNSAESGIIRTYLDFVISLPWGKMSQDSDDIKKASEELDRDHYGLEKVKERILEYLAVKIMTKKNPQAILCLVGPPGVGKTSLALSVAKALNKSFVKQALGGVKDESEIRGHRRTYIGALPGRILQGIQKAGTSNPVFLLDEIDKMSSDYKGDPTSAMLEVLDGEQNRYFSDHYLEEPYDLSQVFFICTANYLGNIPAPLRDRLEIVELSSYTEYEKFEIAKRHLLEKQLIIHGITKEQFNITDQAIYTIIQKYTREAGVRELERELGTIIRKAIKMILMTKKKRIDVDTDSLEQFLGKARYSNNKAEVDDQIGVVTGLAYTQFGGDTLSIEVTYYRGEGRLVLTGQLGDVMKESAQAALSYVKANNVKFKIDENIFKDNDIHIHVPEGAIPKDGPSAGVTIATAIISALSGRKVLHNVGMTGEITLRGRVLPIGGIREKSIAAHRSGLTKILIPSENMKDLDEVPESVKNVLEIVPISTIDEVISYALVQ